MFDENAKQWIQGHVLIRDKVTGEVFVSKMNSINYENFSISLARTISNRPDSWIQEMVFGNGGASVSEVGVITYLPPNTSGMAAELYNETYFKVVNDQSPLNVDPTENYIQFAHSAGRYKRQRMNLSFRQESL